ncbi:hypothetical protein [Nitrosopumilus cobalaminigenes]|uniref:hypothetical protein n=1 Tax=Nitrosopumilus cobalaminigenes TaxID=1470066 RepID=UPI0015C7EE49|nr:hypothetical protein [Nitrosopumilus cobalaminigenes]
MGKCQCQECRCEEKIDILDEHRHGQEINLAKLRGKPEPQHLCCQRCKAGQHWKQEFKK